MKEIVDLLPYLKIGASKEPYPIYGQYLNSDGKHVRTCNNNVYVSLECDMPFKGMVSFFTLSSILEKLAERDFDYKVSDDKVIIKAGASKYDISLLSLDFPIKEEPDIETVGIDEELLTQLKFASKFCGKELYSYIYLFKGGVLATNTTRMFFKKMNLEIKKPVAINPKILSTLFDGCSVGTDENNNTVVFYPNGFAIFTVDNITYYPADKIVSFVETKISDRRVLCNILQLRDWIENVVPIFGFDKQNFIHMKNNSNKLVVTAESAVSGVAVVEQEGTCDNDFEVIMDASYVKDIPSSYDCFVAEGQLDRLVLSDGEGGVIILMGAKG